MARRVRRSSNPARQARLSELDARAEASTRLAMDLGAFLPPGKGLGVAFTDNRYTMIAVRRNRDGYEVRVHQMFAQADLRVVRALARYVVHNDRRASAMLGDFIEANQALIRERPPRQRTVPIRPTGRHHDLQRIFDELNLRHFGGTLDARITWGPAPRRRSRSSIKMGSFVVEDRLIRVHPTLDAEHVPDYFVAWIVFHEMLHGRHAIVEKDGRRCFHTPAFLAEERAFPHYPRARAWERRNLALLLGG